MKKNLKKQVFSTHLRALEKGLKRIQRAEDYLDREKDKLIADKEKIRIRIRKEKEVLRLKNKIKKVKGRRN